MARRLSRRDQRRDAIVDVARDCFLAEGYAATSMSSIAARLGGSKGTLYNYFRDKQALFAAVVERLCGELQTTLFAIGPDAGAVPARLTHFARSFVGLLMTPEAMGLQRLVVSESERFPELGRVFHDSGPKVVQGRIGDYLREQMDAGVLRRADPLIAAQHFQDLAISGLYWPAMWGVRAGPTDAELEQQVGRAVETFLRAYAP